MITLKKKIEEIFQKKHSSNTYQVTIAEKKTIRESINLLNLGKIRVSEKISGTWKTNQWVKKAVLLYLYTKKNKIFCSAYNKYFDKISLKYENYTTSDFLRESIRTVPHSIVRKGAFIEKNVILMPSFVNIGAYIGENTMVDTWTTVGSCAQIGKNVHLSGGVGIGGVLEPIQNNPTIIEDNCFIGARSEIVEGVIIETGSVISMGVYIGQSTKIYDRDKDEVFYGKIPAGSVVVPGTLPSKNGKAHLYCAVIVKKVDYKTLSKTELNKLLREEDN